MDSVCVKCSKRQRPISLWLPEQALDTVVDYIGETYVSNLQELRFWLIETPVPVMVSLDLSNLRGLHDEEGCIKIQDLTAFGYELHELLRQTNAKHFTLDAYLEFKNGIDPDLAAIVLFRALTSVDVVKTPLVKFTRLSLCFEDPGHVIKYANAIEACTSLVLQICNEDGRVLELSGVLQIIGRATRLVRLSIYLPYHTCETLDNCSFHTLSWLKQLHFLQLDLVVMNTIRMRSLVECLTNRPNIKHLSVVFGGIDVAYLFAKHMETDTSLKFLQCQFRWGSDEDSDEESDEDRNKCIDVLMKGLRHNRSLETLRIRNHPSELETKTVESIAAMIRTNHTLTTLDLDDIFLFEDQRIIIGQVLASNTTLQSTLRNAMKKHRPKSNVVIEEGFHSFELVACSSFPYFKYE